MQATATATRTKPRRKSARLIEFLSAETVVVSLIGWFISFLLSPGGLTLRLSALKKGKKLPGGASYPISDSD
jgi:hypothetical protein